MILDEIRIPAVVTPDHKPEKSNTRVLRIHEDYLEWKEEGESVMHDEELGIDMPFDVDIWQIMDRESVSYIGRIWANNWNCYQVSVELISKESLAFEFEERSEANDLVRKLLEWRYGKAAQRA